MTQVGMLVIRTFGNRPGSCGFGDIMLDTDKLAELANAVFFGVGDIDALTDHLITLDFENEPEPTILYVYLCLSSFVLYAHMKLLAESDKEKMGTGRSLRKNASVLKTWLYENSDHPYPDAEQKEIMCRLTGMTIKQIENWMANARRRLLK